MVTVQGLIKVKELLSTTAVALALMFAMRALTLGFPDLIDTTDGRYASIAANMAIDGNWVVPHVHQEGQLMSYWSKPPLAFWSQAGSIGLFGFNEWAVRWPGLLWTALTVALTAWLAQRWIAASAAGLTAVLTAGTSIVVLGASITMTDQPLVAALTGAMIGFGLYFENGSRWWARFGFACLGLSLLAKGPVGLMIPAASFGIFILVGGYWGKFFRIPWGTGLLCMLAVAAPWYLWMEYEEPGFLHYFLMQENFNRLISSDLVLRHGTAHPTFRGVGLLCFIVVTVPWLVVIPWWIRKVGVRKVLPSALPDGADRLKELYFLCWFAAPLIPFAVGKQVLPYYLLPLTQGFILWFVMVGRRLDLLHPKGLTLTASLSTIVISVGMMIMGPLFLNERRSTKPIIEAAVESFGDQHATLVFSGRVPDSAYFYLASPMSRNLRFASQSLEKIREEQNPYWVITRHKDVKNEPLLGYHERLHLSKWVIFERDGLGDEGPSRFATSGLSP